MPVKNTVKTYIENGYYHIYNRGVDKREIFLEPADCKMFLYFLKLYLTPPEILQKSAEFMSPQFLFKILHRNLSNEVKLLSFALMPNHFHLQVKQFSLYGIQKLMRQVIPSYVQYFNRKMNRIGTLFESTYKAVLTETETQHLYLSAYIHRNSMKLINPPFNFIEFSSYPYYLGDLHAPWIHPEEILEYFAKQKSSTSEDLFSYQSFVENISKQEIKTEYIVLEDV